jgi:hypothetical protein
VWVVKYELKKMKSGKVRARWLGYGMDFWWVLIGSDEFWWVLVGRLVQFVGYYGFRWVIMG